MWRMKAACRDSDPELFFPIGTSGPSELQEQRALSVCASCTVSSECLQFAIAKGQRDGIWGGKTEEERRELNAATA